MELIATTGFTINQIQSAINVFKEIIAAMDSTKKNQQKDFLYNGIRSMHKNRPDKLFPVIFNVDKWGYKVIPD
jgi:hypothetical protein